MATAQDINSFRSKFAEFEQVGDPDISVALNAADLWLDQTQWIAADFPLARILWAANYLALKELQIEMTETGGVGMSDLFIRSIGIGDRRVMFGERRLAKGTNAMLGPGEEMLTLTIYGEMFLQLRARNFPAVAVV